jgi:hypothetical protein
MLILVKPIFIDEEYGNDDTEEYSLINTITTQEVNETIIKSLKDIFQGDDRTIKRLGNTDFYTITSLENETAVNYIDWQNKYFLGINNYTNNYLVTIKPLYFSSKWNISKLNGGIVNVKITFSIFNIDDDSWIFETSELLDEDWRDQIRYQGQNLSGLSGLNETANLQNMMLNSTYYPGASFSGSNINRTILPILI